MNLKTEQQRLYELIPAHVRCFVRVCADDSALWISDYPRKAENLSCAAACLEKEGFSVRLDPLSRLWYIDWPMEGWMSRLQTLPSELPSLPESEALRETYALCRLYLLHPSKVEEEQLPVLRRALKLTVDQPGKRDKAVRQLQEEAAQRLREGKSIAYAAGRILAAWLHDMEFGKETKS